MQDESRKNSNNLNDVSLDSSEGQFSQPLLEDEKELEVQDENAAVLENGEVERGEETEIRLEEQSSKYFGAGKIAGAVAKGAWKTAGSIFGFRVFEETAKLGYDISAKSKQKKELTAMTGELAESVSEVRELAKERLAGVRGPLGKESVMEATSLVREKIRALNEKLAKANISDSEKEQMRKEITCILREYNRRNEEQETAKRDRIKELMDLYINNKAQGMLVAKEALNTISIALAQPYLRILGYSGFAALERARKANEAYNKTHFREGGSIGGKLKAIAKDLFINSARETIQGFNAFDKEKSRIKRVFDFGSSVGILLRFAGLVEYEHAIQAGKIVPAEGAKKLLEAVEDGRFGDALGKMGENWLGNARRLLSIVGITEREGAGTAPAAVAEEGKTYQPTRYSYEDIKKMTAAKELEGFSHEELAQRQRNEAYGYRIQDIMEQQQEQGTGAADGISGQTEQLEEAQTQAENISNKAIAAILGNEKIKASLPQEQIDQIMAAKNAGVIEPGKSISEALNLRMTPDVKITLINPDGSRLENFDANLAHTGDTVVHNQDGSIFVYKTSGITMREGQSLEGVYNQIEDVLNKENVPSEIRSVFNDGKGYWGEKITRHEANRILEWWHDNKGEFQSLSEEKQKEFLSHLKGAHSKNELNRLLAEAVGGKTGVEQTSVAPAIEKEVLPMEERIAPPKEGWQPQYGLGKENILSDREIRASRRLAYIFGSNEGPWEGGEIKEWEAIKDERVADILEGRKLGREINLLDDPDAGKLISHRAGLVNYLKYLQESTGLKPKDDERLSEYVLRGEQYLHDQNIAWHEAVSNPEIAMQDKHWPPLDGRPSTGHVAKDAWSVAAREGMSFEKADIAKHIETDAASNMQNKIAEIFGHKKGGVAGLDKVKEWAGIKDQKVTDISEGRFHSSGARGFFRRLFGKSELSLLNKKDVDILQQRRALREYISDLSKKAPEVKMGNKTADVFIKEAEKYLSVQKAARGEFSATEELK